MLAQDLEAVAAAFRVRVFRRGQLVCTAGDRGDTVIVVLSGRLKIVVRSADGGELTLTVIQPGGVFGELAPIDGGPRSADAETLEECRLLMIPREIVQDICARAPAAALALARSVAATLRRLTESAADLVFLDLPRRVAKVLLSHPRDEDGIIQLKMSQEQLARQAAGTKVHDRAVILTQETALAHFAGN